MRQVAYKCETLLFELKSSATFWAIIRSQRTKIWKVINLKWSPRKPVGQIWPYSSWAVNSLTGNLFTSTMARVSIETIFLDRNWIYRIWEWSQVGLVQCSTVRAFQKALTVDFGIKSTYEHSHIQKMDDSYVKNFESSHCFLAAFSIHSCCKCL